MKLLVLPATILLSWTAAADTTTCSDAEQTFSYTRKTSNGGAPLDRTEVTYAGKTVISSSPWDMHVAVDISNRTDLMTVRIRPNGVQTTYSAQVSGGFEVDGETSEFADLWVICEEAKFPVCSECP